MRRIRSKGTNPELTVRRMVYSFGYRFRLHRKDLPGKPDLVFPSRKKIIEVRGCFWHQHRGCVDSHVPKSRVGYWKSKLKRNVRRGADNLKRLRRMGWGVMIIWECETRPSEARRIELRIRKFLRS